MRIATILLVLVLALSAFGQGSPDLSGAWRANLAKSTIPGRAPSAYIAVIDQKGPLVHIRTLVVQTPANQKVDAQFDTSAPVSLNYIRGNTTKSKASWEGSTLRIDSRFTFAGAESTYQEEWTLSQGGTLIFSRNLKNFPVTRVVFEKQPDAAAAEFDQPEKTARQAYKNVRVLGTPASSLLSIMNTYSFSLGVSCEHCHVVPQWDQDDKPAKAMARKMIAMTHMLNQQNFGQRVGVSCWTCHRNQAKPAPFPFE